MAKYRYTDTPRIDGRLGTFSLPSFAGGLRQLDLAEGIKTIDHTIKSGERADHVAARYWGDDEYWWIIALVNGISYPFSSGGWVPGRVIKVPLDVRDVLEKVFR